MVGQNVLLVKVKEGVPDFRAPSPRLLFQVLPQHLGLWGGRVLEALGDQPLYHTSPDEPEVRLSSVGGPYKAPAHLGN